MIKVTIKGAKEIAQRITQGSSKVNSAIDQNIGATANKAADIMRATAPKKSGKLRSSIKVNKVGDMSYAVRSDVDYLSIQRYGTRKKNYPIEPRNKQALYWAGLERPIARVKSHPGITGKPFVERGVDAANATINSLVNNIASIFKNLFSG